MNDDARRPKSEPMPHKDSVPLLCGAVFPLAFFTVAACSGGDEEVASEQEVVDLSIQLTSPAFAEGSSIPVKHTCDGEDVSPPLSWSVLPEGAKGIALISDDPDAPGGTWVHWVLYGLPPDLTGLPEAVPTSEETLQGTARQGRNDFGRTGYGGPCPPRGATHRYLFKLYALDTELDLRPGAKKEDLLRAMEGHILGQGQLMGRYQRR